MGLFGWISQCTELRPDVRACIDDELEVRECHDTLKHLQVSETPPRPQTLSGYSPERTIFPVHGFVGEIYNEVSVKHTTYPHLFYILVSDCTHQKNYQYRSKTSAGFPTLILHGGKIFVENIGINLASKE